MLAKDYKGQIDSIEETVDYWLSLYPRIWESKFAKERGLKELKKRFVDPVSFVSQESLKARIKALEQLIKESNDGN